MSRNYTSVCYVKNYIGSGGSSELFLEICAYASDRYEFTVYGIEGADPSVVRRFREYGVSVESSDAKSKLDITALHNMYKFLSSNEFDVVHAHLPYAQVFCRLFTSMISGTSIVSKQSSMPENYHPITRILERITQPLDDKTVTATKAVQRAFTGDSNFYYEDQNKKWCTIHNGINVEEFHSKVKNSDPSDISDKYGLDDGPVLLNIGRYTPAKSQKDLIPVMNEVVQDFPNANLLMVGYGELENDLIEQVKDAGLSDRIHVTGRAESVYRYYKASDIFLLSSRTEGFGIVNLEAMSSGLPIMATDIPAAREIIRDGRSGVLVSLDNHHQMADEIVNILKSPKIRKEYSQNGLNIVKEKFDISHMSEQYLSIYDQLADPDG